ncbi:hypothetical protein AgCh_035952 [Apium graveolens]
MRFTELPFRNTNPLISRTFLLCSTKPLSYSFILLKPFSSLRSNSPKTPQKPHKNPHFSTRTPSNSTAPWLNKWPSSKPTSQLPSKQPERRNLDVQEPERRNLDDQEFGNAGGSGRTSAIERIVLRLRNLGLGDDDEEEGEEGNVVELSGDEKLGELLKRDWVRPDTILDEDMEDESVLPWEREVEVVEDLGVKKRAVKAPTLAELTIEDEELRRLRRVGMSVRERVSVAKAGVTGAVLEKIHDQWRKSELVRLKFHESLARDMRTAHEIVERRTGGLVIWRSGSVMMVYRGSNYTGPSSRPQSTEREGDNLFVSDVSSSRGTSGADDISIPSNTKPLVTGYVGSMNEEESAFNSLLDGLGPRFDDWWGTGILPVDADLLPQKIPGYKTPFRLLPTGMRPRLTNAEMTNLRKLAKSLPCHFALGRNRNHQGLAAAIIELWERSVVVKIAVKRGIQNTNNLLMAEEIKTLTGGILLLRNKYYIVIYRGKDFVPRSVATALAERQEATKEIQDNEERVRRGIVEAASASGSADIEDVAKSIDDAEDNIQMEAREATSIDKPGPPLAGTLAEFYEAQAQWGREISVEEQEKIIKEVSRSKTARSVKRLEHKLFIAQAKNSKAAKELAKIRESWLPVGPPEDQETVTDEERVMFRKLGLKMKPYLPLGIRGVFDGVIENMHLHWKHRELVKLISKQKDPAFVEETARLLEFESGGILIDIVRVPKGYAIIYYRGKNYRRPISLRPRNLPTKARALKRWMALQRYEALSEHIVELEKAMEQLKSENGDPNDKVGNETSDSDDHSQIDIILNSNMSEDEWKSSDEDEGEDLEDSDSDNFDDDDEDMDYQPL